LLATPRRLAANVRFDTKPTSAAITPTHFCVAV
jgi:hypothetical protein